VAHAAEEAPRTVGQRIASFAKELAIVVVGALIIATLIRAFVGQMFLIPSGSMEHTLEIADRIAVQKITGFDRGDIVVFADPGEWTDPVTRERGRIGQALEFVGVLPDTGTEHLVKRVIGMPGDHVKCCDADGRITVNGQPLDEQSYLYGSDGEQNAPSAFPFDVVVPADRIWVMGDHRANSADSRCHLNDNSPDGSGMAAFVPISDVVGPVFAVVAPMEHARLIKRPATFASVPDAEQPPPQQAKVELRPAAC
jgi:signal peptidase I